MVVVVVVVIAAEDDEDAGLPASPQCFLEPVCWGGGAWPVRALSRVDLYSCTVCVMFVFGSIAEFDDAVSTSSSSSPFEKVRGVLSENGVAAELLLWLPSTYSISHWEKYWMSEDDSPRDDV